MLGALLEESALGAEAGVGEDRVDAAEGLDRLADEPLVVSHSVTSQRNGDAPSRAPPSSAASSASCVLGAGGEHEPVAVLDGVPRGRRTDPGRAAGDHDHIAVSRHRGRLCQLTPNRAARPCDNRRAPPGHLPWIPIASARSAWASPWARPSSWRRRWSTSPSAPPARRRARRSCSRAGPGASYDVYGKVVDDSVKHSGSELEFEIDRPREQLDEVPVSYSGTVPDPFREGREVIITGKLEDGHARRRARQPDHQVPVEVRGRGGGESRPGDHRTSDPDRSAPALSRAAPSSARSTPSGPGSPARKGDRRCRDSARRAIYAMAALLTVCVVTLEISFLRDDFSVALVADHSSTTTPTGYKLTAMWSSQAGSLLLWAWVLSLATSRRAAVHPQPPARAGAVGDGGPRRARRFFIGLMLLGVISPAASRSRSRGSTRRPWRASGSTRCCATRRWRSTRRCSTRATSCSRSRSRSRSRR